jgi:hypothetical protein
LAENRRPSVIGFLQHWNDLHQDASGLKNQFTRTIVRAVNDFNGY